MSTDASNMGLGAVLSLAQDGEEKVIATWYFSSLRPSVRWKEIIAY